MRLRTYSELRRLHTFQERFDYLRLKGDVGKSTFGFDRYLNQQLYKSQRWRQTRDAVIIRDNGCDLGFEGYEIVEYIIVHHMNPVSVEDIEMANDIIFDIDMLVCTAPRTHLAIHYGDENLLPKKPVVRRPGDTSPWR